MDTTQYNMKRHVDSNARPSQLSKRPRIFTAANELSRSSGGTFTAQDNAPYESKSVIHKTFEAEGDTRNSNMANAVSIGLEARVEDNPQLSSLSRAMKLPYEACFGLLCLEVAYLEPWEPRKEDNAPVRLSFSGNAMRFHFEDSGANAGTLISDTMVRLANEYSTTLVATSCTRNARRDNMHTDYDSRLRRCPVRIVVYGLIDEKDAVADLLSNDGLFLQHPGEAEYDRRVRYLNPQYLLRPGAEEMPTLNGLPAAWGRGTMRAEEEPLGEMEKNQIFQIFESARESYLDIALGIRPSSRLYSTLKPHQIEALTMMVEREGSPLSKEQFPSLWEKSTDTKGEVIYRHIVTGMTEISFPQPLRGGILADEMGLGKTLSALALICHHIDRLPSAIAVPEVPNISRATLIVTPKSVIHGWQAQINKYFNVLHPNVDRNSLVCRHTKPGTVTVLVYHGTKRRLNATILKTSDVVLTTYDTLRSELNKGGYLYANFWARIILDEAHKIRNRSSKVFQAACAIRAQHRWCLTGTPVQNMLDDFGALLTFIGVPPFLAKETFDFWVAKPITTNRPGGFQTLRKLVLATCLRRTKENYSKALELPLKTEKVEEIELSKDERELYDFFKRRSYLIATMQKSQPARNNSKQQQGGNILVLIGLLRMICNHGEDLIPAAALAVWRNRDPSAVSWDMLQSSVRRCGTCGREADSSTMGQEPVEFPCQHILCEACLTAATDESDAELPGALSCAMCNTTKNPPPLDHQYGSAVASKTNTTGYQPSTKVQALLRNLTAAKSVVFSCWTRMLDLVQQALEQHGIGYQRIDGQSSLAQRKSAIDKFDSDPMASVMLATIGAAGEGVDLTAASSVHLIEPHWNPMVEAQAVDRVHRIGQSHDVVVFRYIVQNSIDSYVRWIQQDKLRLIEKCLSSEVDSSDIMEARWVRLLQYLS
ncbi:SNF2 family N-terminal domain-containing protein [Xylariales sp. PMI_506]|nr:SNF2 family N-terminal domain-containing protein [Xylariales sp. PMI_506]